MKYLAAFLCLMCFSASALAEEVTAATLLRSGTVLSDMDIIITVEAGEDERSVREVYIGQQLKRTIYAGQKIKLAFLGAPILIKRNANVTMVYSRGTMRLTAKGRALTQGAMGDEISILNVSSRKKVYGIVSGHDLIEVTQ